MTGIVANPKLLFEAALWAYACSNIFYQPSFGRPKTISSRSGPHRKNQDRGAFLDIKVLDHVILSADEHFPFADEGIL